MERPPFAVLLTDRRKKKGLSQEALGSLVGKSQSAVSAWEKGTNGITLAELYSVAQALDMDDEQIAKAVRLAGADRLVGPEA